MSTVNKIMDFHALASCLGVARADGLAIISTNGAFDLLSARHVLFLEEAKKQGDILVVGINSDASVRRTKGSKRPIIPEKERALLVASLACTDYVFLFEEDDPRAWLPILRPDVHVNSQEYTEQCIESDVLKEIGAKLVLLPRVLQPEHADFISTSDIIKKICDHYGSSK